MQRARSSPLLIAVVACAALFVWFTSRALPDVVATHFGASGAANGFMPRDFYVVFMLAVTAGLPLLLAVVLHFVLGRSHVPISVPNRDYWLAPERRARTLSFLRTQTAWFAIMLAAFMSYVHWLVLDANTLQPARLSTPWLMGGMTVFLAAVLVWAILFVGRFRKRA